MSVLPLPPTQADAVAVESEALSLGTNLAGISPWSTELPFLDAFKSSAPWTTQCAAEEAGCSGSWATEENEKLDLDEQGWVRSIPAPEDPPEFTRVGTLLYREINGRYPGGQYLVLYEGEGTIEYKFDAQKDETQSAPGRDVINVTPSDAGIYLIIRATDPNKTGNYIRNLHVVPAEYERTFASEIFNPVFIDRIKRFKALRFMDWMSTNNSKQREASDRPQVEDASYGLGQGVPVEIMVELANRIGANPWFNMPHQATDEYIDRFAQIVKEKLDPTLRVYVEFSNEVWNWQFQQAHYALDQGKAKWGQEGDAYMQWYGMRTAQMSDIWKRVFDRQGDRVVSIMATQTVWQGLESAALDCPLWVAAGNTPCYQHGIDAFAIAAYFSGNLNQSENRSIVESWLAEPDGGASKAFTQIETGELLKANGYDDSLPNVKNLFQYHLKVAQDKHLDLVVYEGGQHLVSQDNEKLTSYFIELNRDQKMYNIYQKLLNQWREVGGTLFMNFSDVGKPSRWGSWGSLEYLDQEHSPKYNALINFLDNLS